MVLPVIASLKNKLYLSINFLFTALISFLLEKDPLFCQTWSNPITLRELLIWSSKLDFISSPFTKLWKMNLSCVLGFSSSFICSQYFNESNEADIAKGYLPTSLLQARFDEYLFTPIRNLQNFVWILSGKKSSYDSSRLWLFTFDAIFTKFRLYGIQISEQYNNIGLTHASNSLHWSVGKMNDDWNFFLIIKSTLRQPQSLWSLHKNESIPMLQQYS